MSGKAQNAVGLAAMLGATAVTKKVADGVWRLGSGGKTPPTDPTDPDVAFREAVVWALLSGAAVSLVRLAMAWRFAGPERRQNQIAKLTPGVQPATKDTKATVLSP